MTVRHIGELHGGRKGSGGEHGDRQSDAHGTGGKTTSFHFKSIPFCLYVVIILQNVPCVNTRARCI